LSTEERTEIQTKIDKLQATNKIKQLEQQKNAQEDRVKSVTESIDLQKQLLNISDSFDGSKQANAVKTVVEAAAKSAKTEQDKIKQLEQQKNAQEDSVKSVTESIDLQKQLLNISDSFDGSKQANAVKTVGEAAAKSAKTVQDKMTKLMLQQELAGKSTEEQIAVYKRYLSTLEE